jgi:hypothetical protein
MEAAWMKAIPSASICNFFYLFFVVYAVILALALLGFVGIAVSPKLSKALSVPNSLGLTVGILVAGTQMLFFYLICSRSLLEVKPTQKEGFVVVEAKKPASKHEKKMVESFQDLSAKDEKEKEKDAAKD